MMTDTLSDMLTRIRNASMAGKGAVTMPFSNLKFAVAKVLQKEGFVGDVQKQTNGKFAVLSVVIKHENDGPRIRGIHRISKPGQRVYAKSDNLPTVLSGFGVAIMSTSAGIMTNKEARARKLGGEVLCEVF